MLKKWTMDFPGDQEYAERRIYLYLPESYEQEPLRRYPVLYMFDGHNVFLDEDATYGKCLGMKEYMDSSKRQLIVVAVECNHSPKFGRLSEYSPFDFQDPKFGRIIGRAGETMQWMIDTLKTYIDANYRTIPDRSHTFVAGSSMGGLISLYAVTAFNEYFSGAACLSPSIWTNMKQINNMIENAQFDPNTTIYMDYGQNELSFHKVMSKQFRKVSNLLLKNKVLLTTRIVPNGDHCEACWEKQIPFFMDVLSYGMKEYTAKELSLKEQQ